MPFYLATMQLGMVSGVTADSVQNTFAFSGANAGTDAVAIEGLLNGLYDDLNGIYPAAVSATLNTIKVVNLDDPPPRYPILQASYTFPVTPTGNQTIAECCIGASFQAVRQSGIPQSRRRGRVYIGPIDSTYIDSGGLLTSSARTTVANAFSAFHTAAAASAVVWSVYSRVDQDMYAIDNGWVDNAPDIQRRRGYKPTVRLTW